MELLFHLKEKNAAIRDLKPDNMFLVGDSDNPDTFLTSGENYSLGLIDLETSVNFEKNQGAESTNPGGGLLFSPHPPTFLKTIFWKKFLVTFPTPFTYRTGLLLLESFTPS